MKPRIHWPTTPMLRVRDRTKQPSTLRQPRPRARYPVHHPTGSRMMVKRTRPKWI